MAIVYKPVLSYDAYLAILDALTFSSKRYAEVAEQAVTPGAKDLLTRYSREAAATLAQLHNEHPELAHEAAQ